MSVNPEGSGESATVCWIQMDARGGVLHAPVDWDDPDYHASDSNALTACGRKGLGLIPGIFSRMGRPRCRRCCAATGLPDGTGSPKNDDACRAILGLGGAS